MSCIFNDERCRDAAVALDNSSFRSCNFFTDAEDIMYKKKDKKAT